MSVRREERPNRDGSVRYRWAIHVVQTNPKGEEIEERRTAAIQTERGAKKEEQQIRAAIINGTFVPKKDRKEILTLKKFSEKFMENYVETNNKPSEKRSKESAFRVHLIPYFGEKKLNEITVQDVERFKALKATTLAPGTVNNLLTVLHKALTVAEEWGYTKNVPRCKFLKPPPAKRDFLDFDEANAVLAAVDPDWKPFFTFVSNTGLRTGEILGLKWNCVDFKRRLITVRETLVEGITTTPKSKQKRFIELNELAFNALKQQRAIRQLRSEYVFCDDKGEPLTQGKLKWPLWRACDKAGVKRIRMHIWRHTFCSHLMMLSSPPNAVQELMGHSDLRTTMEYMHLSPSSRRGVVDSLVSKQVETHKNNTTTSGNTTAIRGSET